MTRVSDALREARALLERRVPHERHLAEVVALRDDMVAVRALVVGPVHHVDVRTVGALRPDALHGPAQYAGPGVPLLVSQGGGAACHLRS